MRASLSLLLCSILLIGYSQSLKDNLVNGTFSDAPLEDILDSLSTQTNYFFSYNSDVLPKGSLYTITADNIPIDQFLSKLLVGTGLKYSFFKDQIILNYEPPARVVNKKNRFFDLSGNVRDENGEPLSDVNIFLDGSTIGSYTDDDGNFVIENIPPGFYDIVFSYIGYESAVYSIVENNGGSRIQNHQMSLDEGSLEEVEVISNRIDRSANNWFTHYSVFKNELLGRSSKAEACVIENPEALNFAFDNKSNTLLAFSKEPIEIRNDALGYRISYILESFKKQDQDLRFRGKIRFRNLNPLNGSERRLWKRNRKISYKGSINHFKKSLINGTTDEEGFKMYRIKSLDKIELTDKNTLKGKDILVFKGDHYQLDFRNYLLVEYKKEKESTRFLTYSESRSILYKDKINAEGILVKNPTNQLSIIKLLNGPVKLDLSGQVLDKFGVTTLGYWSWERTGDLVPINYDPKFDEL